MSDGFRLRIKYRISGRLAFLSHLETIRSMERVIRRAGLPFAITEGFNPHMKVTFGPALPVGAGSEGEYLDVRLREYVAPDRALSALQAAAPENLMPVACEYTGIHDDAIDMAFPVSKWRAEFACDPARVHEIQSAFDALVEQGYIEVIKKKGRNAGVKRVEFSDKLVNFPVCDAYEKGVFCEFTTRQTGSGALRPDKFIEAAFEDMVNAPRTISLTRLALAEG